MPLDLGVDSGSAAEAIPGEVRMTMRKMAKKDVTTKHKVGAKEQVGNTFPYSMLTRLTMMVGFKILIKGGSFSEGLYIETEEFSRVFH